MNSDVESAIEMRQKSFDSFLFLVIIPSHCRNCIEVDLVGRYNR